MAVYDDHGFRFVVYSPKRGAPRDRATGTLSREFRTLKGGLEWAEEMNGGGPPGFNVYAWNEPTRCLWAIDIKPDLSWTFQPA
jgi:hypothetical protein